MDAYNNMSWIISEWAFLFLKCLVFVCTILSVIGQLCPKNLVQHLTQMLKEFGKLSPGRNGILDSQKLCNWQFKTLICSKTSQIVLHESYNFVAFLIISCLLFVHEKLTRPISEEMFLQSPLQNLLDEMYILYCHN